MITDVRRKSAAGVATTVAILAHSCSTCGARVAELRRGRCWGCYGRWAELRPVGRGASCVVCNERRRSNLRLVELHSRWLPFCHTCAAATVKLVPVPHSLEALRTALVRNRRQVDRRVGALDPRVFPRERRLDDRRLAAAGVGEEIGLLHADDVLDLQHEIPVDDADIIEITTVSFNPLLKAPDRLAEASS